MEEDAGRGVPGAEPGLSPGEGEEAQGSDAAGAVATGWGGTGARRRTGQEQDRGAPGARGQGSAGGMGRREARRAAGEEDSGSQRRWGTVRGGCEGHQERRKGAEGRRCAGKGRDTAGSSGGCGDGGHRREHPAEGIGPAAEAEGAAEYGSADRCGRSGRAAGRGT